MPLASGSFPYPKSSSKNAVSPTKEELDSFPLSSSSSSDMQPFSQHTDTRASSQTYRSTYDSVDEKLGVDKLSPSHQTTTQPPTHPTNAATSAGTATTTTTVPVGRYVLPLEERPNDQKRIRKLISSSPLIAVAAVFAAFSVFLSVSATRFTWLDYSEKFNNLVKGVETTTRYQWFQDHELICISARPSGVDPDIIEGCVDHGITYTFMKWLPILNEGAMVFGAIALGLCIFSSRHIRWWIAKFTSPTARIMFLVGDVTGACGSEPEWCKPFHCRDCGILCTPATPGIFASISAILHFISFTVYWFISKPKAAYRTEGPWLIVTAGGLQMGCAFFAFWSQRVVCPVKHVWKCECDLKGEKAKEAQKKRQAIADAQNAVVEEEEEESQGLHHVIEFTTTHAERVQKFIRHQSSRLMVKGNDVASKLATRIRQKALERLPRNPDEDDDDDEEEDEEKIPATPPGPTGPFSKPFQPRELKSVTLVGSMKKSARRLVPPGQTLQARALLLKRQASDESVHQVLSPSELDSSIESFPVANRSINNSTSSAASTGLVSPTLDQPEKDSINGVPSTDQRDEEETAIKVERYE